MFITLLTESFRKKSAKKKHVYKSTVDSQYSEHYLQQHFLHSNQEVHDIERRGK